MSLWLVRPILKLFRSQPFHRNKRHLATTNVEWTTQRALQILSRIKGVSILFCPNELFSAYISTMCIGTALTDALDGLIIQGDTRPQLA